MNKKKILIVCSGFYPRNSPRSNRATELAKEFARQGHQVTVLTPKDANVHPAFEMEHNISIHDLGTPRWKSPDFGKSRVSYLLTRAFNRLFSLAIEYPDIEFLFKVAMALRREKNYDLLISIAVPYPIHWGVAWKWNEKQTIAKTWVADCGDPYIGGYDTFKKWFYFKCIEKWFMRKVDYITIPIENGINGYFPEFHSKIRIIPQGFKFEPIDPNLYKPNAIPHFAFAGSLNLGNRDPRPFLKFLTTLESDFVFTIYTRKREMFDPFIEQLKGKLFLSDFIPREELLSKLALMDFLINFDNNTTIQVPSKLIDYNISNRPVLNITQELDKNNIQNFLNGDYTQKMELGNLDDYRIENVCTAFIKLHDCKNH